MYLKYSKISGFKVALTIQPFFSTQSRNYEEGLYAGDNDDEIWLAEKNSGIFCSNTNDEIITGC